MNSSTNNNNPPKTEFLGLKSNLSLGSDGLSSGVGGAVYETNEENERGEKSNFSLLKVGAKADLNTKGLDVGAEGNWKTIKNLVDNFNHSLIYLRIR